MAHRIKIGDFVKLTGSTLKTVIYYHQIGLLAEPARSSGGYRLYGPAELTRMQLIKHLKDLGLDLKRIKEILGDARACASGRDKDDPKTLREVLQSLQTELQNEKNALEARIAKIEKLLREMALGQEAEHFISPSFQIIAEILGSDKIGKYVRTCPELFDQQRKVYRILDDFQWGEDYRESFRALAEFFKAHPQQYQIALDYGARLAGLDQLPEDDPAVDILARESAAFIKSLPQLMAILGKQGDVKKPLAGLYHDMVAQVESPAQIKHGQLLRQYLSLGDNY